MIFSNTFYLNRNIKKNETFIENQINVSNANSFNNSLFYKIKGINYLNKCKRHILNNINNLSLNNNIPKISVIIPVYNCETTIELSIISIQNQNFIDFEIILVNDFSSDNSLQTIIKIQKKDKRIKILNNKRNMGTLYSRCIGTLKSNGKYIFALDNDDLFLSDDLFEKIYKMAESNNYDIIEFKSFLIKKNSSNINDIEESFFNDHLNNLILHQPELSLFPISANNNLAVNDFWIWGKCIKSKIYKKSIRALGKKRYSIYNCWTEDISMVFIIFNFAQSYIFLNIYGIFHVISNNTASNTLGDDHKLFTNIFLLDIIFDFSKSNEESKKFALYKALEISKSNITILSIKAQLYLKSILMKLLKSRYINNDDKALIKREFEFKLLK